MILDPALANLAVCDPPFVPAWAVPHGFVGSDAEAAFMAGAALNSLDDLVRSEPPWIGAWRQRLALGCAAATVRLAGRNEDEAALRDAWILRRLGDDPGPAGNMLLAWKRLCSRTPAIHPDLLQEIAKLLAVRWSGELSDIADWIGEAGPLHPPAPFAAAAVAARICDVRPDAELLAWWLADWALAQAMRWQRPVPLFMAQRHSAAFRMETGRGRIRPGEPLFERAMCIAVAHGAANACRMAAEIARRAGRLAAVMPKLRSKGAGEAIRLLLDEDAVSGSLQTSKLSRWGSRRLFERLIEFDAVRELSGRPTFRLYGL